MSESRISGRLDTETFDLYEKLREETGFTGQRKDTRFLKAVLCVIHDLLKRGLLSSSGGTSPAFTMSIDASTKPDSIPEFNTETATKRESVTAEQALSLLNLREGEYEEIRQACERSYGSLDELLRVGVLNEARNSNMLAEKTTQFDFTNPVERGRRKGAGYAYVESVVQQLMEKNLQAKDSWDLLYLTRGQVAKLTGTNRADINAYFDNHREMLEQHHTSIGFTTVEAGESHNRLRVKHMKAKSAEETGE